MIYAINLNAGPNGSDRGKLYHWAQCNDRSRGRSGGRGESKALYHSEGGAHTLPFLAGVMHCGLELISGAVGKFHSFTNRAQ